MPRGQAYPTGGGIAVLDAASGALMPYLNARTAGRLLALRPPVRPVSSRSASDAAAPGEVLDRRLGRRTQHCVEPSRATACATCTTCVASHIPVAPLGHARIARASARGHRTGQRAGSRRTGAPLPLSPGQLRRIVIANREKPKLGLRLERPIGSQQHCVLALATRTLCPCLIPPLSMPALSAQLPQRGGDQRVRDGLSSARPEMSDSMCVMCGCRSSLGET